MDSEEREGTGTRTFRKWVVVANEGSVRERERERWADASLERG